MATNKPNLVNLSPELLDTAGARLHDYESFGRAIVGQALRAAKESTHIDPFSTTIPAEIMIRSSTTEDRGPVIRSGCVDVCVLGVCVHVEWQ